MDKSGDSEELGKNIDVKGKARQFIANTLPLKVSLRIWYRKGTTYFPRPGPLVASTKCVV
jgi:hypothetical protein